ncbi:hypothetical protein SGRIM119S_04112 [Streptomyces griseorubiginosus]
MPMLLIKGFYDVKGTQPDGDTVAFTAADPTEWDLVGGGLGRAVERTASGRAKLRLDAIDALETHYGAYRVHQPLPFAHAARDELLSWIGFTDVQREDENVLATTPATVPGFVLTRGTDIHGRCIALAGRGTPPGDSGREIDVDAALLRTTLNHHLRDRLSQLPQRPPAALDQPAPGPWRRAAWRRRGRPASDVTLSRRTQPARPSPHQINSPAAELFVSPCTTRATADGTDDPPGGGLAVRGRLNRGPVLGRDHTSDGHLPARP